jgi:hypothetical protein
MLLFKDSLVFKMTKLSYEKERVHAKKNSQLTGKTLDLSAIVKAGFVYINNISDFSTCLAKKQPPCSSPESICSIGKETTFRSSHPVKRAGMTNLLEASCIQPSED